MILPNHDTENNQPKSSTESPASPTSAWLAPAGDIAVDGSATAAQIGAPVDAQIKVIQSLYEVAVASAEELTSSLNQVAEAVAEAFRVEYVTIHLNDYQRQTTTIAAEFPVQGYAGQSYPFAETPVHAYFFDNPEAGPLVLNDVTKPNPLFDQPGLMALFEQAGVKSCLIVPLRVKETVLGTMHLMMISHQRAFSLLSLPFAQIVANLIAVSIQNVQLAATLRRQIEQSDQVAAFGRRVMALQDQGAIIREAATLIRQYLIVHGVSVALHWQGEPALRLYLIEGDRLQPPISVIYEQAWLRYAYENRMPLVLNRLAGGTQLDYEALVHHAPPNSWDTVELMQTALIIPLIAGGQPIGTLNLTRRDSNGFLPDDLAFGSQVAVQLAVALENVRLFSQTTDQLRSERLRGQLGGRVGRPTAERVDEILLSTLQQVGVALGAQRARVRLSSNLAANTPEASNGTASPSSAPVDERKG